VRANLGHRLAGCLAWDLICIWPCSSHHDKDNHHVVLLRLLFCNEGLGFCLYV